MVKLTVYRPGESALEAKLDTGAYVIGASKDCHVRIDRPDISGRHAQVIIRDNKIIIMDLGSSNGTFIGNDQIYSGEPRDISNGATVHIGRTKVTIYPENNSASSMNNSFNTSSKTVANESDTLNKPKSSGERNWGLDKGSIPILEVSGIPKAFRAVVQEIKKQAHKELLARLNLKKLALAGASTEELNKQAATMVREILSQISNKLPAGLDVTLLEQELVQEAIGLGPLETLIARDDISEIMVNGPENVYVEQKGRIYKTDMAFADNNQVLSAIERIVAPLGRRIDESSPMVDARLSDGSRVNAIIPPLSLVGPSITIRKFSKRALKAEDLIDFGSISEDMVRFLAVCVAIRKNIIISGGTGSGKTTLLNVLSNFLPNRERIVTIEDAAELQLSQEHLVRLESRPPNIEGKGAITIRDLVRNSLRMRPDRIVIGECRGGEALDMLQAMNTGHDGSLTTIHANSPRDAMARLETLVLMSGFDLPVRAIREQVASAIDIVVQVSRQRDGSRKVENISEIIKMEGDIITMQDIFVFKHLGWNEQDKIVGKFEATGSIPTFMEDITRAKLDLDISIFRNK